jgi:formate hydrogenlyase subunit 4
MEVRLIIYGLALILTMIFYPTGFAGMDRWLVAEIQKRIKGEVKP